MTSPQSPQRLERLCDLCDSVLDQPQPALRHDRTVVERTLERCSVFYPRCSCGWLGTPCLFEGAAWSCECEVEALLVDSAARARRIMRG